jgi:hypothetical protein
MSFGLSTTPTYRIRAMTAHPTFPIKPEDTDDYFHYAAHMQGRLGLKSGIEPRRARSASPRRSRASIEFEMMKIAAQKSKPPPHNIECSKKRKPRCHSQNTQREFKIGQVRRKCHSAQSLRTTEPRSASPRRPRSAMPPSVTSSTKSIRSKSTAVGTLPQRSKSAFVRRNEIQTSDKSLDVNESRPRSVTFFSNEPKSDDALSRVRKISSDTTVKPRASGMWARGVDLVRKKCSTG